MVDKIGSEKWCQLWTHFFLYPLNNCKIQINKIDIFAEMVIEIYHQVFEFFHNFFKHFAPTMIDSRLCKTILQNEAGCVNMFD